MLLEEGQMNDGRTELDCGKLQVSKCFRSPIVATTALLACTYAVTEVRAHLLFGQDVSVGHLVGAEQTQVCSKLDSK